MTEVVRVDKAAIVAVRVADITATVMAARAAASVVHRLVRTIRTATATIMARADVQASTVADRVARAASTAVVRVARVDSTVAARADREALDLVQAEWAVQLQFHQ